MKDDILKRMLDNPEDKEVAHEAAQSVMTDKGFNGFLDEVHKISRQHYLEGNAEVILPRIVAVWVGADGPDLDVRSAKSDFNKDRHEAMYALGRFHALEGHAVAAVFLSSEAYVGRAISKKALKSGKYTKPSDDPKAIEVLMTSGLTLDGRAAMVTDKIKGTKLTPHMYTPYQYGAKESVRPDLLASFFQGFADEALEGKALGKIAKSLLKHE